MAGSALERARAKLEADDDEGALEALLVAWRELRSARLADVIDRVSERLVARDGPVKGKTVKARTEAWLALAPKASARDVGRLLATPWPGKWQDAVTILEPLLKLPHDPRIAMSLAKVIEETPWDTWTSRQFYGPLILHLRALRDLRTLRILRADLERKKSRYWERGTRPSIVSTIEKLSAHTEPELDDATQAILALFAGDVSAEKAQAKSEAELLAAIYAAPDDDAPRIVFADWLLERSDPRGELISLQLAGANEKRAATLVRKHGAEWAGPLDRFVHEKGRRFERGFLACATLQLEETAEKQMPRGIDDPAWATLRKLRLDWDATRGGFLHEVLALPGLQQLRSISGIYTAFAAALSERPALEELELRSQYAPDRDRDDDATLREGAAFPNLRRLGFEGDLERLERMLGGALGRRLEQVTLYSSIVPIGSLARLVERLGLTNVKEVRTVTHLYRPDMDPWRFAMRRDKTGRFTLLHGVLHEREHGAGDSGYLVTALTSLEPQQLKALTIDRTEPSRYDTAAIRRVEREFARFTALETIEVPWERLAQRSAVDDTKIAVIGDFWRSEKLDDKGYETLWRAVSAPPLALTFDSWSVNNGAHQALPADPLPILHASRAKKRTWGLDVYRKDGEGRVGLSHQRVHVHGMVHGDPDSITRYLDWLAGVSTELGWQGTLPFVEASPGQDGVRTWRARQDNTYINSFSSLSGWGWVLDPALDAKMPFAELEKLPAVPGLEWLRAVRTPQTLILLFGPSPAESITREQLREFDAAAFDVRWAQFERTHGYRPHDRVERALGPMLAEHGYTRVLLANPAENGQGKLLYERDGCAVLFEPHIAPDDVVLTFSCTQAIPERSRAFGPDNGADRVADADAMDRAVDAALRDLPGALAWFDAPPEPKRRRR